jgi:ATP-dependent Zn protease
MALGGRVAEEITFDTVTTGASDDLRRVTELSYNMIQMYGMSDAIGQLAFPKDQNAMIPERMYSETTAQKVLHPLAHSLVHSFAHTLALAHNCHSTPSPRLR